jgi:hypothetical protein
MAARRLLIVMLVLLGLSTLAAALVPQHGLRDDTTSSTTTTQPTTTAATPTPIPRPTKVVVGGKKLPIVFPVHVGQQLPLYVYSRFPTQLEIPAFGLLGFATKNAPAQFAVLPDAAGTYGILFSPSGKVAAKIRVVAPGWKKKEKKAKSGARGESGPT